MNANELRIENYVSCSLQKGVFKVSEIIKDNSLFSGYGIGLGKDVYSSNCIKPIPLTEEWLLKFGFEKTKDYYLSSKPTMYQIFKLRIRVMANEYTFCHDSNFLKIEYVHELQNLYFALAKNELQIKF